MMVITENMKLSGGKAAVIGIIIWCVVGLLTGCNSTPSFNAQSNSGQDTQGGGGSITLSRFTLPNEISAIPAGADAAAGNNVIARAAADPGTDYSSAVTQKYIQEKSLHHYEHLDSILDLLAQTNYTQEIDQGPYRAIVSSRETVNGYTQVIPHEWVVQSDSIREDGRDALRIQVWMDEEDFHLKAEFKVFSPPTRNDDGSYENYGEWIMNLKFDDTGEEDYVAASCTTSEEGLSLIRLYEKFSGDLSEGVEGLPTKVKAIMYRSASTGYGKVSYPDYDAYFCPDCEGGSEIPHALSVYAYDRNTLAVQTEGGSITYKDRNDMVPVCLFYGVFDGETGEDVLKTKSFGFPVRYTAGNMIRYAYYGSYEGRHELRDQDGTPLNEGTVVTREDTPPDQEPETYTVGKTFSGVLVKRTYQQAHLDDIQKIPLECWVEQECNLNYDPERGQWFYCPQTDWSTDPPTCVTGAKPFDEIVGFETLIVGENNTRKMVEIFGWDETTERDVQFIYENANAANGMTAGFYEAEIVTGDNGEPVKRPVIPRVPLDTESIRHLFVYIGGSIYIEYRGADTGWVEKQVDYFDDRTWRPVFVKDGDQPFVMPEDREFYINFQGVNYIVQRTGDEYNVHMELQTVCNPGNAQDIVPDGTVFYDPWNPEYNSTYEFITDPSSEYYLMLVYKTIGDNDRDMAGTREGVEVGKPAGSFWGLEAVINRETVSFNWERPEGEGGWGSVTYLMKDGAYKLIDDPIMFNPISVNRPDGASRRLALSYDGWLNGVPYAEDMLMASDWVMTDDIKEKIINIPPGTTVQETGTGKSYLIKPLEVSLYLTETTDPGNLNIVAAQALDLAEVPIYAEHGMGEVPASAELKYIDGYPLEEGE